MSNSLRQEPSLSGAHRMIAPTSAKLGGDAAFLHMMRMLNHTDPRVSNQALFRLADLSNTSVAPNASKQVIEHLVHAALFDKRWHVYYLSARLLSLLEDPRYARKLLVAALRANSAEMRARVLRVLEKIPVTDSEEIFLRSLTDSDPNVRAVAAEALGKSRRISSIAQLLNALNDEEQAVRFSVIEALGNIGSAEAYPALVTLYEQGEPYRVRQASLEAISQLGLPEAEDLFLGALVSSDWRTRKTAVEGLDELPRLSRQAAVALAETLADPVNYIREHAAKLLARVERPIFEEAVLETIEEYLSTHSSEHIRTLSVRILGYQLQAEATRTLINCLYTEETFNVQRTIVRILERIGTQDAANAAYAWRAGLL